MIQTKTLLFSLLHNLNNTSLLFLLFSIFTRRSHSVYKRVHLVMDITLYKMRSEKQKLDKDLTADREYTGYLRDQSSVIDPVFMIEDTNLSLYNYAYIPNFNRYYFIDDIIAVRTGLWELHLSVDVLMSFNDDIKDLHVILEDSQSEGASDYISGDQWTSKVKTKTDIINFSNGLLESGEYILITAGG